METDSSLALVRPKVAVAALASPLEVGADRAPQAAADLAACLHQSGCEVFPLGAIVSAAQAVAAGRRLAGTSVDAIAFAPASWFEDYLVLDLLEECPLPVCLWPLPGMETGALCGTQQLTCYLRQLGTPFEAVFGDHGSGPAPTRARAFLRAAALHRRLRRARIGLAGQRVRGMTEVAVHEIALKRAVGPRVVTVDLVGLLERSRVAARSAAAAAVWRSVRAAAGRTCVGEEAGLEAAGVYLALRELASEEGLAALAFGCYPDFMGCACLASSLLADEGIPVGCEGDVNTVVAQAMLHWLTAEPTHNTDWLDPLPDGSVVLTHCGSGSYRLAARAEDITLAPVRLANRGVCSLFPARPGPVTLVSLLPLSGLTGATGAAAAASYQMAVLEGEALPTEMVFPGNPLRVRFARPAEEVIHWIFEAGIGHHWAAGCGHVAADLRAWARIAGAGVRLVEP